MQATISPATDFKISTGQGGQRSLGTKGLVAMCLVSSDRCPPGQVDTCGWYCRPHGRIGVYDHKTGACTRIQRSIRIGSSMGYRTDFAEKDFERNLALGLISKNLRPFERASSYFLFFYNGRERERAEWAEIATAARKNTETRYVSLSFFILVNYRLKSSIHFFIIQSCVMLSSLDCLWFFLNFQEQTQHYDNDSSWECSFVIGSSLYDFGNCTLQYDAGWKAKE